MKQYRSEDGGVCEDIVRNDVTMVVSRSPPNLPVGNTSAGQDQDSLLVFLDAAA